MGTYHTFFVADESRLDQLFPGWVPTRVIAPVQRESLFGEPMPSTWEPTAVPTPLGAPSLHDDVWGVPIEPVVPADNPYLAELEAAAPPGLRAVPHFRARDCLILADLGQFARTLGSDDAVAPPARLGPQRADRVDALPVAAASRLASLGEHELLVLAKKVLDGDHEHEWDVDDFAYSILAPLQILAREAALQRAHVCHHWA